MVEGGNLLDRDFATARFVDSGADDSVRSFPNDIEYLVVGTCRRQMSEVLLCSLWEYAVCWRKSEAMAPVSAPLY